MIYVTQFAKTWNNPANQTFQCETIKILIYKNAFYNKSYKF